jgi:hypothetical protein
MGLSSTALTAVDAFTAALYPPQTGTDVLAADVEAGEQVLVNRTHNLNLHKLALAGGTMTGALTLDDSASSLVVPAGGSIQVQAGGSISIADDLPNAGLLCDGKIRLENNAELQLDSGTLTQLLGKTRIQAQESLSDADHNIDVNSNKNRIIMRTPPAATRVLTILKASASPAPVAGDWFEITVLINTSTHMVTIAREGSIAVIASIGDGVGAGGAWGTVLIEYDGTNWRFVTASGLAAYGADA